MRPYLLFLLLILSLGCPKDPKQDMAPQDMAPIDFKQVVDLSSDGPVCPQHKMCGQDSDCQETLCNGSCIGGECIWGVFPAKEK